MKYCVWLLVLGAVAVAGCSRRGGSSGGNAAAPAADELKIRERSVEELPKVGDYLPPIDDGRVEAAPPAGWKALPRGRTYLMAFDKGDGNLPRITINAETPPEGSPENLTSNNIDAFVAIHDAELRRSKRKVEEPGLAIQLGDTLFVRHVRRAAMGGTPVVVQSLQTIKNGRLYTIELIAAIDAARAEEYEESLKEWRDYGYAVAANLRFAKEGEQIDPLAELNAEPAQPAEEKATPPESDKVEKPDAGEKNPAAEAAQENTEKNPVP